MAEFEKHGAGEELDDLIQEGFIVLAEALTPDEKERAGTLARRIAEQPSSGDPDYHNHLPEAEAMIITARPELGCTLILLDELAARAVAAEEGLRITGFPGVVGRAGLDRLLMETKARSTILPEDVEQCLLYLTKGQYQVCLLVNFGQKPLGIRRFVHTPDKGPIEASTSR